MRIFLINGRKRSGKDFFGSELALELKNSGLGNSVILKFADPVKEIISESLNLTLDELEYLKNDESLRISILGNDISMRFVLQHFATEAMQSLFGKTVWRDLLIKKIKSLKNIDNVIITDFRFYHEDFDLPGSAKITVKILGGVEDNHCSENSLENFNFDYVVDNSFKNPKILKSSIQRIIQNIS